VSIRESEGQKPHIIVGGRKRKSEWKYEKTYLFGTQNLELNDSVTVELAEVDEVDQPIETHTEEMRERLDQVDGFLATYAWDELAKLLHKQKPRAQEREWRPAHLAALGITPREYASERTAEQVRDEVTTPGNGEDQSIDEAARDSRLPSKEKYGSTCLFCGKTKDEIEVLIVGPSVSICDECVELCQEIIAEELKGTTGEQPSSDQAEDEEAELQWGLWPRNQE
jgi:hypothetical protein